eukprot:Gregarina_sp_Poly_1__9749@NODE_620_length_7097_cov_138_674395_g475_i0_p3_GENE_NODE_620_length_7097_cov_138_674395_g475_i0NODE_620_length_7097_cov_138_674395_g475_i0_p3_ORF_typecomplete_len374_score24_06Tme5_EGF_like/PF09064_10/0_54Tme5_EGF_like/PF09064_10/1_2e03Tme5_EGF_like/PF09064_10/8_8e03_NODE_620_length_7097_cov_138_674395_g475_i051066227
MISLRVAGIFILQSVTVHGGGNKKHNTLPAMPPPIPQFICPEGFVMEDSRCAKHLTQPLVPVCSEGILQADNTCLIILPPGRTCPPDMVLVGGTCIRTFTAPAAMECPPGFTYEPGFKKSTSVCVKPIMLPPPMICPPGAAADGEVCIVENIVLPALSCPSGTTLTGNACMRTEVYECGQLGPGGKKHGGRWLEETDREIVVYDGPVDTYAREDFLGASGQRMLGKKGFPRTPADMFEVTVVGQQCERRTLVPPMLNCPAGATLIGRECVASSIIPRIPGEPLVSVETLPPTASCPPRFVPCGSGHKQKKGGIDCCSQDEAPFVLGCPAAFSLVGGTCQSFRPADFICAQPGFTKHKHKSECVAIEYHVPVLA